MLSWALCVSTLNRVDVLCLCVAQALRQTRPPAEVIVIDASDDWAAHSSAVSALLAERPEIALRYRPAPARSLPAQRNAAIALATADILFLIDDDALMHADCAATIMSIYEADRDGELAAVGATGWPEPPPALGNALAGATGRHRAGLSRASGLSALLRDSALARLLWREVLLMPLERKFVRYDPRSHAATRRRFDPARFPGTEVREVLEGYTITVRRRVALAEPFDDGLVGYATAEDLDATYRFGRHGFVVRATDARLYHHVAASGRLDRYKLRTLEVLNPAYFVRRNARPPAAYYGRVVLFCLRYLLAATLKDAAARRWSFPEVRGVLRATALTLPLFLARPADPKAAYRAVQARILRG
jgi:glycosyltransferase involved in cell wall biosynthesis